MVWEERIFDDMGMVDDGKLGDEEGQSEVEIAQRNHPLSGNFIGVVKVYSQGDDIGWGRPGPGAVKIVTMRDDPSKAVIFGFETGARMSGMNAPARRVGFYLQEGAAENLTPNGWRLFDAAVKWCAPGR